MHTLQYTHSHPHITTLSLPYPLIYILSYLPAATGNSAEAPFSDKSIKSHVSTTSFSINGSSSYIYSIYSVKGQNYDGG